MKPLPILLLLFSFLIPAVLHASQEPADGIPISKTGDWAHATFVAWAGSLENELLYPAQLHMDMTASIDIAEAANGMTMDMEMDMEFDLLLESPTEMRSWGGIEVEMTGSGMDLDLLLDIQLGFGPDGLRFLLDDHGFLEEQLDIEMPKAFQLSADRAGVLSKLYMDFILESVEMHGPEAVAAFQRMNGFAEIMHPATTPRILLTAQGMDIIGWGTLDGMARIQTRLKPGMLEQALGGQAMPFDSKSLEDMIFEMVVDLETGELMQYLFEMDIPMEEFDMNMKMRVEMGSVPPTEDAPSIAMPPADQVMVLDEYFDQFLPMIEMALEMQRQQMRTMRGEEEAEDDYDF
ncbi:MAG: hypothetical protein ACYTEP_01640 [Planctomycetota bacterium]|jgi:hypothetical protein